MAHCVADAMTFSVRFFYLIQVVDRMMGNYGSLYAKRTSAVGIADEGALDYCVAIESVSQIITTMVPQNRIPRKR